MITRTLAVYKHSFTGIPGTVWLLSLVSFINRCGTMVLPFMTVYLTTVRGFTLGQAGWAMTSFGVGSVVGSFLGGKLTDKGGYFPVQFWSLLLGGLLFVLMGQATGFWQIVGLIFILSVVSEAYRPALFTAVAAHTQAENRTRSYSLLRTAVNIGWSLGPAFGGWLAASVGYDALFWVDGLTCIAAAVVFRMFLHPSKAPENKDEEEKIEAPNEAKSPYRDKKFLFFLVLTTFGAIAFMQFLSSLPVFYKQELGMSEAEIGWLLALNGLIVVFMEMPLVYVLEKKFSKMDCIAWGVLMYGFGYLIFNIYPAGVFVAVVSMIALSFGEIFNMPFTNTYIMNRASVANRGQYMGLLTMCFAVAHVVAPLVGLQTAAHFGFEALWYVLTATCLVAFAGFVYLKKAG